MLTVFPFTTTPVDCSTLRWLQAAILNLFSERTRLSYFFYYTTAGIFHFHTKIGSKRLTRLSSAAYAFRHPYSLPSRLIALRKSEISAQGRLKPFNTPVREDLLSRHCKVLIYSFMPNRLLIPNGTF